MNAIKMINDVKMKQNETNISKTNTIEYTTNGSSALKLDGIDQAQQQYIFAEGGENIKKHKIIQEAQMNGFKVTSYVEDISLEEQIKKDNKLAQQALSIMKETKIHIDK